MAVTAEAVAILLAVAFLPPIVFSVSVARSKRYRREPGHALSGAFLWGATGAAFLALIVNTFASGSIVRPYLQDDTMTGLVVAIVVAPLVEETVKPLVLYMGSVRKHTDEPVDGLIYGAIAGLGFSATENLLYEVAALIESGFAAWVMTAIARTFSSSLLHATATAVTGYGIARYLTGKIPLIGVVPYFLGAALMHAAFNTLASINIGFGILPIIILALFAFSRVKRRIHELSLVAPHGNWHRVGRHHVVENERRGPTVEWDPPGYPQRAARQGPRQWQPVRPAQGPRQWRPERDRDR